MTRKALGRGIDALISNEATDFNDSTEKTFLELDIDLVQPNLDQPRSSFPDRELDELAQSISANGIVQPIVVRKNGKQYQIVAGERRWRAAQRVGLQKIPAILKEVSDDKLLELALIENIQRQELNPIEESRAYQKLIESLGLTQEEVAKRVGKTRTFIANYLRLLRLPDYIAAHVENSKLSVGHARALLAIEDSAKQKELTEEIIGKTLSVRETEKAINRLLKRDKKTSKKIKPDEHEEKDPNIKRAETKLRRLYATQVKINSGLKSESGKIELEFYGEAELDRLYKLLMRG